MDKKIGGVWILSVFIASILSSSIAYNPANTYYCNDTNIICVGTRLSESMKTCYYIGEDGSEHGKRCLTEPYWQVYNNEELNQKAQDKFGIPYMNKVYWCPLEADGKMRENNPEYVLCYADDGTWKYFGEFL